MQCFYKTECYMDRKDWQKHAEEKICMNAFQASYHMLPDEFNDLEEILWEDVQADEAQSQQTTCGNDHIVPKVRL